MNRQIALYLALFCILCSTAAATPALLQDDKPILGFSAAKSAEQHELEAKLIDRIDPAVNRELLRELTDETNMAGTPGDRRNAEFVSEFLQQQGFDVRIYEFHVYLPYPRKVELEILGEEPLKIIPGEKGAEGDTFSLDAGVYPPFNAYSPSGDVTGEIVYANYGRPEDYEQLAKLGVEVKDRIVMVRYGRLYRGSKVNEAEIRGVAGLILYSDPADDGYMRGDIYPRGPMRPADGIQRGSILYMFNTPGDPLTPNGPSLKDAERIDPADAGLPTVPTMPLSYGDAGKILEQIEGAEVPDGWQGGLPFRYHVGAGPIRVRMNIEIEYAVRPVWDVIGILHGSVDPDQWVIVGGHRDAWLYGANDPHSGGAVFLEAARVIAKAAKEAGGLRRSLVVASWDAEEFGVIGSVEWVELMREELSAKAVSYMNADAIISGRNFGAAATPTLRPAFQQVLEQSSGPDGENILQSWRERQKEREQPFDNYIFGLFGGGSDHTGFLHYIGVPCLSEGFGGRSGIYHSAYDTFTWMERFGDPGFQSHAAASRLMAMMLTRLANAEVLPFAPSQYVGELQKYIDNLEKDGAELPDGTKEKFSSLLGEIEKASLKLEEEIAQALDDGTLSEEKRGRLNGKLLMLERAFIHDDGVPGRPWNRNILYSTDRGNGYGIEIFPGLRAVKDDPELFEGELNKLEDSLLRYKGDVVDALAVLVN